MKSETCNNCSVEIYPTAVFCHKCGHRLKCYKCGAILIKDANNCISCGKRIIEDDNSNAMNTVTYRKTKDEIFCDVSLTDSVAKDGIGSLIANITNNRLPEGKFPKIDIEGEKQDYNETDTLDVDSEEVTRGPSVKQNIPSEFPHLNDVEMNINCSEAEWILIYAFYESEEAKKTFTKKAVYDLYMSKRKTEQRVKNFTSNWKSLFRKYFATKNDTEIKFKIDNLDHIKKLITGQEKGSSRTVSKRKTPTKNKSASESETTTETTKKNTKTKTSNSVSYSIVTDLNLHPTGKKSLKDFYSSYSAKGSSEIVLIFIYYIEKILKRSNIDNDAIYTCYKHIGLPVPIIKSAIDNLHIRKGWINTANRSDLKITIAGENHIEHEMGNKK